MDLLGRENNDVIDWVMSRVPQPEQLSGHSYKIVESSEALFTYEPSLALVQHVSQMLHIDREYSTTDIRRRQSSRQHYATSSSPPMMSQPSRSSLPGIDK